MLRNAGRLHYGMPVGIPPEQRSASERNAGRHGPGYPKWGARPLALVVLKPSEVGKVSEKEILRHVREYADKGVVSKQVVLVKVGFVDAIDKTSVGKINKVVLREKHLK